MLFSMINKFNGYSAMCGGGLPPYSENLVQWIDPQIPQQLDDDNWYLIDKLGKDDRPVQEGSCLDLTAQKLKFGIGMANETLYYYNGTAEQTIVLDASGDSAALTGLVGNIYQMDGLDYAHFYECQETTGNLIYCVITGETATVDSFSVSDRVESNLFPTRKNKYGYGVKAGVHVPLQMNADGTTTNTPVESGCTPIYIGRTALNKQVIGSRFYHFDGVSQYAQTDNCILHQVGGLKEFTLFMNITNIEGLQSGDSCFIGQYNTTGGNRGFTLLVASTNPTKERIDLVSSANGLGIDRTTLHTSTVAGIKAIRQLVFRFNDGDIDLWVDGVLTTTLSTSLTIHDTTDVKLSIGSLQNGVAECKVSFRRVACVNSAVSDADIETFLATGDVPNAIVDYGFTSGINKIYNRLGDTNHLTVTNFNSAAMVKYDDSKAAPHLLLNGFSTSVSDGDIPANLTNPEYDILGNTLTNPPGEFHNGAESDYIQPICPDLKIPDTQQDNFFYTGDVPNDITYTDMVGKYEVGDYGISFRNGLEKQVCNHLVYDRPMTDAEKVKIYSFTNNPSKTDVASYLYDSNGDIIVDEDDNPIGVQ